MSQWFTQLSQENENRAGEILAEAPKCGPQRCHLLREGRQRLSLSLPPIIAGSFSGFDFHSRLLFNLLFLDPSRETVKRLVTPTPLAAVYPPCCRLLLCRPCQCLALARGSETLGPPHSSSFLSRFQWFFSFRMHFFFLFEKRCLKKTKTKTKTTKHSLQQGRKDTEKHIQ